MKGARWWESSTWGEHRDKAELSPWRGDASSRLESEQCRDTAGTGDTLVPGEGCWGEQDGMDTSRGQYWCPGVSPNSGVHPLPQSMAAMGWSHLWVSPARSGDITAINPA